ncbi:hypothetical protein [Actinomadura sp. B10D3]|uniref:hypothetical protein n=1 Tax=Actinomadura sp. B10D3 TaxID=3153557 RepID=UPI00325EF6C2
MGGFCTAQVVDADTDAERPWLVTADVPGLSYTRRGKPWVTAPRNPVLGSVRTL